MKKLFFLLALSFIVTAIAVAASDPFEFDEKDSEVKPVHGDAIVQRDGSVIPLFVDPTAPKTGSAAEYVNWINKSMENGKNFLMATLVTDPLYYPSYKGARCIWNADAYKFKQVGTDSIFGDIYEVTCIAGPSDKFATYLLKFKVRALKNKTCTSNQDIVNYFNNAANRTAKMASDYAHNTIKTRCSYMITPGRNSVGQKEKPLATPLTIDRINAFLNSNNYPHLRGILENSRNINKDDSFANPARRNRDAEDATSVKRTRDDDEDGVNPARHGE